MNKICEKYRNSTINKVLRSQPSTSSPVLIFLTDFVFYVSLLSFPAVLAVIGFNKKKKEKKSVIVNCLRNVLTNLAMFTYPCLCKINLCEINLSVSTSLPVPLTAQTALFNFSSSSSYTSSKPLFFLLLLLLFPLFLFHFLDVLLFVSVLPLPPLPLLFYSPPLPLYPPSPLLRPPLLL